MHAHTSSNMVLITSLPDLNTAFAPTCSTTTRSRCHDAANPSPECHACRMRRHSGMALLVRSKTEMVVEIPSLSTQTRTITQHTAFCIANHQPPQLPHLKGHRAPSSLVHYPLMSMPLPTISCGDPAPPHLTCRAVMSPPPRPGQLPNPQGHHLTSCLPPQLLTQCCSPDLSSTASLAGPSCPHSPPPRPCHSP